MCKYFSLKKDGSASDAKDYVTNSEQWNYINLCQIS